MYSEWIIDWFVNHGTADKDELCTNMDSNFFENEYIDSFSFIKLINDIEEKFNISFDNEEFQDRSFATITGLGKCIEKCVKRGNNDV